MRKSASDSNIQPYQRYTKLELWQLVQSRDSKLSSLMQKCKNLSCQKEILREKLNESQCRNDGLCVTSGSQTEELQLNNVCCYGDVDQLKYSLITMKETLASLEHSLIQSDRDQKNLVTELRKVKTRNELLARQLHMYGPDVFSDMDEQSQRMEGGANRNPKKLLKHKRKDPPNPPKDKPVDKIRNPDQAKASIFSDFDRTVQEQGNEADQVVFLKKQIDELIEMISRRDNTIFRLCEDVVTMRECKENAEKKLNQIVSCHNEAIVKVLDQLNDANKDLFVLSECLHKKVSDSYPLSHFLDVVKLKVRRELENTNLTRERNNLLFEINTVHRQNENLRAKLDDKVPTIQEDEVTSLIDALKAEIKQLDDSTSPTKVKRNTLAAGSEADLSQWGAFGYTDPCLAERGSQSTREGNPTPTGSMRNGSINRDRSGSDSMKRKTRPSMKKVAPPPPTLLGRGDQLNPPKNHFSHKSNQGVRKKDFFAWWKHMSQER